MNGLDVPSTLFTRDVGGIRRSGQADHLKGIKDVKKFTFYVRLLFFLLTRLDFSSDSLKEFCRNRIRRNPSDYHARFLLAEFLRGDGKDLEAIDEYEVLIKRGYRNPRVIYGLAMAAFRGNLVEKSEAYFRALLEEDPSSKVALDHLGRINLIRRNYNESISCFEKSLQLQPDDPLILENLAYSYYNTGQFDKAYKAYEKACLLNPNAELEKNLALAKCALERENLGPIESSGRNGPA